MLPSFLVACLAFLKIGGVCELDASRYLNVPSSELVHSDRATFEPIEATVKALAPASSPKAIRRLADELMARQRGDEKSAVLDMIKTLEDDKLDSCTPQLAKTWLRSYAVMRSSVNDEFEALAEYLFRRGRDKFLACAKRAENEFVEVTLKQRNSANKVAKFLNNVDQKFLRSVWVLRGDKLNSVRSYSLVDQFKSPRLRQFVERRTMSEKGFVSAYLTRYCNYIKFTIGEQFELLNLGRALASYEIANPYLARVNEYYRIFCVESQKPDVKKYLDEMVTFRGTLDELDGEFDDD